ncbi:MAG: hypothetical protein KF718_03690 [Polyangiaceae bacterium]|nr:hypothetical protein [Polyangiaceae bacterium]
MRGGARRTAWAALVMGLVLGASGACSSSSSAGGLAGGCEGLCSHLQSGENCAGIDFASCVDECKTVVGTCPARSKAVIDCVSSLAIVCTGVGQAVGKPTGAMATELVYLTTPTATLLVEDAACASAVQLFNDCEPFGSGGAAGSGGTSGLGGTSSGGGGSGGVSGGGTGGTAGSGGSGGSNPCASQSPYHCPASNTCWPTQPDCSTVAQCGSKWVACSPAESASGYVVSCTHQACIPTPTSCNDANYPVYCPARNGAHPGCYSPGVKCNTVVYCEGIGRKGCQNEVQAVDCAANLCLTPKVAESTNAACSNGLDDDGNGFVDCNDFHCLANPSVTVCQGETHDVACSNGLDDDSNGYADCQDFACQISPAVTKCKSEKTDAECHDGIDNDGDGKIDCADTSCTGSPFTLCP